MKICLWDLFCENICVIVFPAVQCHKTFYTELHTIFIFQVFGWTFWSLSQLKFFILKYMAGFLGGLSFGCFFGSVKFKLLIFFKIISPPILKQRKIFCRFLNFIKLNHFQVVSTQNKTLILVFRRFSNITINILYLWSVMLLFIILTTEDQPKKGSLGWSYSSEQQFILRSFVFCYLPEI